MKRCPKCRTEMEYIVDEDWHPTQPGYMPTRAFYLCPNCHDSFPIYDRNNEGEP